MTESDVKVTNSFNQEAACVTDDFGTNYEQEITPLALDVVFILLASMKVRSRVSQANSVSSESSHYLVAVLSSPAKNGRA